MSWSDFSRASLRYSFNRPGRAGEPLMCVAYELTSMAQAPNAAKRLAKPSISARIESIPTQRAGMPSAP